MQIISILEKGKKSIEGQILWAEERIESLDWLIVCRRINGKKMPSIHTLKYTLIKISKLQEYRKKFISFQIKDQKLF